jgi:hypothetical protein
VTRPGKPRKKITWRDEPSFGVFDFASTRPAAKIESVQRVAAQRISTMNPRKQTILPLALALALLTLLPACSKKNETKAEGKSKPASEDHSIASAPAPQLVSRPIQSEDALTPLIRDPATRQPALAKFEQAGDRSVIPAVLQVMRFSRMGRAPSLVPEEIGLLRRLSGQELPAGDWESWMEWWWREGGATNHAGFPFLQQHLYAQIHSDFGQIFDPKSPAVIDKNEIVPRPDFLSRAVFPLNDPASIPNRAIQTSYLMNSDIVVGVEVNGEHRAYPIRLLVHHEVVNDALGGHRVLVTYNPFSRSAHAYIVDLPGEETLKFNFSGLYHRGDSLIYDSRTKSLWSSRLGSPVLGSLCKGDEAPQLQPVPVTYSSWYVWRHTHHDTTLLSVQTGELIDYEQPDPYQDYYASDAIGFPIARRDDRLHPKAMIFGLVVNGEAVVYPYNVMATQGIVHDVVGGERIGIIAFANRSEFRAYRVGEFTLVPSLSPYHVGEMHTGREWLVTEAALTLGESDAVQAKLERAPGTVCLWHAWQLWHPETRLYNPGHREPMLADFADFSQTAPAKE